MVPSLDRAPGAICRLSLLPVFSRDLPSVFPPNELALSWPSLSLVLQGESSDKRPHFYPFLLCTAASARHPKEEGSPVFVPRAALQISVLKDTFGKCNLYPL